MNNRKGFTLLEILLVVAAIAILAGIVIVAINPTKQLGETRDAQRRSDVNTILNAVYQFAIGSNGALPTGIDAGGSDPQVLGTGSTCDDDCGEFGVDGTDVDCLDMSGDLVEDYIVGIPIAPGGTAVNTDYYIFQTANGRVTVGACDPDQASSISVTR